LGALAGLAAAIMLVSYLTFTGLLVVPPLAAGGVRLRRLEFSG